MAPRRVLIVSSLMTLRHFITAAEGLKGLHLAHEVTCELFVQHYEYPYEHPGLGVLGGSSVGPRGLLEGSSKGPQGGLASYTQDN